MASSIFRFKQFELHQHLAPFRLGTDAVLLGAWAKMTCGKGPILDVGTGTGILALMAAQRNPDRLVWAVERHPKALEQAAANFTQSPFHQRLHLFEGSIPQWKPSVPVDDLLCNPPYFLNHTKNPNTDKESARHGDINLPWEWAEWMQEQLTEEGRIHMVLPEVSFPFWQQAMKDGMHLQAHTLVRSTSTKAVSRHLCSWGREQVPLEVQQLTLYASGDKRSAEFEELCRAFYL